MGCGGNASMPSSATGWMSWFELRSYEKDSHHPRHRQRLSERANTHIRLTSRAYLHGLEDSRYGC